MPEPDWSLWRSFAAVVEQGSLSGAARHLGMTQPTMGRHIEELERTLGATLFERTLQGLKPTETGLRLYEPVEGAQRALAEATLMAEGTQEELSGS
ncbi:MAG TPA: LysR family transcriptional regulator, partial [Devosia sp.]